MTLKVLGNTVVDTALVYTINQANVSAGGNVSWFVPLLDGASTFQGSVSGYTSGALPASNVIDKFPFATDSNATDVGDLPISKGIHSGQSSTTHGYCSGGYGIPLLRAIDKFPFAVDTNATSVGNLGIRKFASSGQSSEIHGYVSGGYVQASPAIGTRTVEKFSFAFEESAQQSSNLTDSLGVFYSSGQSSSTHGYVSGGANTSAFKNNIEKFPFAVDANATDVGDLSAATSRAAGQSSTTQGYSSGGGSGPPTRLNTIDKFPFATDTNATDIGDLSQARQESSGQSSTVSGYTSGGDGPPIVNTIDKFSFSTDTNATDVGDLTVARMRSSSQQARTLS